MEDTIHRILQTCDTWAVVGLSGDQARPAYAVAAFLQSVGKRIVPVHPRAETVLGETGYPTLAALPSVVDCVDVFRRSSAAGGIVDEAIAVGARAVWLQLGVVDEAAGARARSAGLDVVMNHCPKIEWPIHFPIQPEETF